MKLMNVSSAMVTVTTAEGAHFLAPRQVLELDPKVAILNLEKIQARIKVVEESAPKPVKPNAAPAAETK